jgi:hypothetical protein
MKGTKIAITADFVPTVEIRYEKIKAPHMESSYLSLFSIPASWPASAGMPGELP